MKITHAIALPCLPLLLMQACAHQRVEGVTAQLTRTETVIQQAESTGTERDALAELQQARDKLAAARRQLDRDSSSGDREAMRLAKEAELDAQYAVAAAQTRRQQAATREVQEGLRVLQQEAQRNTATSPARVN